MTKRQAIEMISKAAAVYEENLNNKNLLIIYGNPSVPCYIETKFLPRNFLHLTGVSLNKKYKTIHPQGFIKMPLTISCAKMILILRVAPQNSNSAF